MSEVYRIYPKTKRSIFARLNVTLYLILINVIIFILASVLLAFNEEYIRFIAISASNVFAGKYLWTFLTSMFMHAGFFHLFVNMLSLFFVGSLVEKIIGPKRYVWFYLASGIFASLLFVLSGLLFPAEAGGFAVGASGAIFGLIGLLMILTPNLPVYLMFIPIPIKMKYAAPGMLIVLWLVSLAGSINIGNSAHLGGFLFGLGFGFYLRRKFKKKTRYISRYFS